MRVFVNSIHKSGTNLVEKLVQLSGIQRSGRSLALSSIEGPFTPIRKLLRGAKSGEGVPVGLESPADVRSSWLSRYVSIPGDHYMSGHAPYSEALAGTLASQNYRVLQVYRDPRSVLVSWAKYCDDRSLRWYPFYDYLKALGFEDRVRFFLRGGEYGGKPYFGIKELVHRTAGWLNDERTMALRYEDLVGASGGGEDAVQRQAIELALNFIGLEFDENTVEEIQTNLYGGTHTFREGRVDGWREALNAELAGEIVAACRDSEYQQLGYRFD